MVNFSLKCAKNPQSVTAADYAELHRHGLTDGEIAELVSMAGLAVYASIMADATAMEPDAMFAKL